MKKTIKDLNVRGRYIDRVTFEMYDIEKNLKLAENMLIQDIIPDYKYNEYVIHGKDPAEKYLISVRIPFEVADLL